MTITDGTVTYGGVTYGATSTGFVPATVQVLLAALVADALANIDPGLDTAPDQPIGQLFASQAEKLAEVWELAATAYNGFDPDAAEGPQLVSLCSLTGTLPQQATYSSVLCTMTLGASASIPAGSLANVTGQPSNTWQLIGPPDPVTGLPDPGPVVSTTAGTYSGWFYSTSLGANLAPAGSLAVITAPVSGWTAVANALDAYVGNPGYQGTPSDDTALRQKREAELAAAGASTIDALQASLDELPGMVSSSVLVNPYTVPNTLTGLPPKSYVAVVWDGLSPAVANNVIAQAVWNGKPSGMQAYGTVTGVATDSQGVAHVMSFERVAQLPLYLNATATLGTNFPAGGIAALKAQLVAWFLANITPGGEVVALALRANLLTAADPAVNVAGVIDVPYLQFGLNPSPTNTGNLFCAFNQIYTLNTANILINGS